MRLLPPVLKTNHLILNWIGGGALERAPTVLGPWNPITPVSTPPYADPIAPGESRFYRLRRACNTRYRIGVTNR